MQNYKINMQLTKVYEKKYWQKTNKPVDNSPKTVDNFQKQADFIGRLTTRAKSTLPKRKKTLWLKFCTKYVIVICFSWTPTRENVDNSICQQLLPWKTKIHEILKRVDSLTGTALFGLFLASFFQVMQTTDSISVYATKSF